MADAIEWDHAPWGQPRRLTLAEFLGLRSLPGGYYLIEEGGLDLPMLVENRGAALSFVGFHAAMNPLGRKPLPFFQGRKLAPRRGNLVLLSDPSLALDAEVKVGWFLGNQRFDLQRLLPAILDHADRLMGADRRLLWGCSAGGTAALRYARAEDTAVAVNPQTIVAAFTRGRWRPWLEHGWGLSGTAAEQRWLREHADLTGRPPAGRVVYLQNRADDHLQTHMRPLLAAMAVPEAESARVRVVLGDWGAGHAPAPPAVQKQVIAEEATRMLATEAPAAALGRLRRLIGVG